ncbi:MAG: NTP transferase domain-containing protein [Spirochaetaceae bacterium]|jgi:spore coat polysaccharide biosynthesis protein SpsF|nr:NTP transferase domain-containing protein [Spirochaetaceae bacterium]
MNAVIVQARLDSRRLPGKSLLPLEGKPLVFRVMEALRGIRGCIPILVCPEDSVSAFSPLAREAGFELVPGPKEDVLRRYCIAIRRFKPDRIIRATADNPFVFIDAAEAINGEAERLGADYAGYQGLPCGAGVESVSAEALLRADREAPAGPEREHVCPYLYTHPELFLLHRPLAPAEWQDPRLRVTVDTEGDYRRAEALFRALSRGAGGDERYQGAAVIGACRRLAETDRDCAAPDAVLNAAQDLVSKAVPDAVLNTAPGGGSFL